MRKLITILLVLFSTAIFAQSDIYMPDRPGFTYNTHLVGLHQMDLEFGFGYQYMNFGDKTNIFYNTTAIRYGAFKWLEFRYQMDFGNVSSPTINEAGVRGASIGMKFPIYTNDSILSIALVTACYLPNIGKPYFAVPNYAPSVTLALQKSFGNFLLLGNSGVMWNGIDPFAYGTASVALYYFPTKFGYFIETFCMYSDRTEPLNIADFGFVYSITDNIIMDFSVGLNYVTGFDDCFINAGLAWRIPNKNKNL